MNMKLRFPEGSRPERQQEHLGCSGKISGTAGEGRITFIELITFERRMDMGVMVGRKAPDFTAKAFHKGAEKEIKLSDFNGKWVMLCFYPADFTCV